MSEYVCHWPGCGREVPRCQWSCMAHWHRMPADLRKRIWWTYAPDDEPTAEHQLVVDAAQRWIVIEEEEAAVRRRH